MTTARRSPRSSWIGVVALVVAAGTATSAHRRDEYLQAARLAIEPDRVEIALDLTPGIAVADRVLADLDSDGNHSIDAAEGQAYAQRVLRAIAVDVDGTPLALRLIESTVPDVGAVRNGEGALRLRVRASMPDLGAGVHRLRYRNDHRADRGAYLANALAPADARVTIEGQRRDPDQRELTIEYTLRADATTRLRAGLSVALAGALVWLVALRRRPRALRSP
jgi:hypothetical protein